ncbi:hypothetical protein [Kitasatospora sp. LaBMicrA B282]|uniref:hypothetical protein n=1 Tax=Kitasatospora sp. LaBMicrA B282 TaxID=3420949 RepID=UPI003D14D10B
MTDRPPAEPTAPTEQPRPAPEPAGGEPACLLHLVCAECGAITEQRPPATCWRCGATVGADAPE